MSHRSHRSHRLFLPDDSHFDDCFVRICLDSQDLCELKKSGSHRSHRLFLPDASHFDDCFVRICLDSQNLCELKKSGSHRSHRLFLPDDSHFDDCFVRICLDSQDLCELKKSACDAHQILSMLINAHHILSTAFPNVVSLYSESKPHDMMAPMPHRDHRHESLRSSERLKGIIPYPP